MGLGWVQTEYGSSDEEVDVLWRVENGRFERGIFLDKVFKLSEAQEAHVYIEGNKVVGKVILRIPDVD